MGVASLQSSQISLVSWSKSQIHNPIPTAAPATDNDFPANLKAPNLVPLVV